MNTRPKIHTFIRRGTAVLLSLGRRSCRALLILTAISSLSSPALARRVVCIDDLPNDAALHEVEGYERARAQAGDLIVVTNDLTDCLANVMNGDTLVIACHGMQGGPRGTTFTFGGRSYNGFGNGQNELPLPPGFGNLMNVTVLFTTCYSGLRVGQLPSMADRLRTAMNAAANMNTVTGFRGQGKANVVPRLTVTLMKPANLTAAAWAVAMRNLLMMAEVALDRDRSWRMRFPVNRPVVAGMNPPPNQQTAAQAVIDRALGAGRVMITIPNQVGQRDPKVPGYSMPIDPECGTCTDDCYLDTVEFYTCDADGMTGIRISSQDLGSSVSLTITTDCPQGLNSFAVRGTNLAGDVGGFDAHPGQSTATLIVTKADASKPAGGYVIAGTGCDCDLGPVSYNFQITGGGSPN